MSYIAQYKYYQPSSKYNTYSIILPHIYLGNPKAMDS